VALFTLLGLGGSASSQLLAMDADSPITPRAASCDAQSPQSPQNLRLFRHHNTREIGIYGLWRLRSIYLFMEHRLHHPTDTPWPVGITHCAITHETVIHEDASQPSICCLNTVAPSAKPTINNPCKKPEPCGIRSHGYHRKKGVNSVCLTWR